MPYARHAAVTTVLIWSWFAIHVGSVANAFSVCQPPRSAIPRGTVSSAQVRAVGACFNGPPRGLGLRSLSAADDSISGTGRDGNDLDSVADGGAESLLGGQALQALEFWKTRRPSPDMPPSQVVGLLMAALQKNDNPAENDGLRTVFEFSGGMCRRAVGGTADSFVKEARFSVFAATVCCQSFTLNPVKMVADRFATQVVNVVASDGRRRRFLWTLERQRRPPDTGKWLIYGVVSSDVDGVLSVDG